MHRSLFLLWWPLDAEERFGEPQILLPLQFPIFLCVAKTKNKICRSQYRNRWVYRKSPKRKKNHKWSKGPRKTRQEEEENFEKLQKPKHWGGKWKCANDGCRELHLSCQYSIHGGGGAFYPVLIIQLNFIIFLSFQANEYLNNHIHIHKCQIKHMQMYQYIYNFLFEINDFEISNCKEGEGQMSCHSIVIIKPVMNGLCFRMQVRVVHVWCLSLSPCQPSHIPSGSNILSIKLSVSSCRQILRIKI